MKRSRDPLVLSPQWHVDCRIEADLPDDNVIGTRFLINVVFGALAVAAIIFTGWLIYLSVSLRYQIRDWEQRIGDNRAEEHDIQRMQHEYSAEAIKIDQAYALIKPQLNVSAFMASLGRTRPEQMSVDTVEWSEAGVIMRGSLRETSQQASQILGDYRKQLSSDDKIGTLFPEIVVTDVDRAATGNMLKFEIAFRMKATKP